jgi:hypothetical protein
MATTLNFHWKGTGMLSRIAGLLALVLGSTIFYDVTVKAATEASLVSVQKMVYQTTWQHGKIGWSSSGGGVWQVQNGELSYDGSGESAITAPASTRGRSNYAVEIVAQALDHSDYNGTYGFGIIFRAPAKPDLLPHYGTPDALGAGIVNTSAVVAGIYVYPQKLASSDFDPGQEWHTYRVEVRGTSIRLLIDGQLAAQTRSTRFLSRSKVGLFSIDDGVSVKSFKLIAL